MVAIVRDDTGDTYDLESLTQDANYLWLRWPLGDALKFSKRSGYGIGWAAGWRLVNAADAGVKAFFGAPPRCKPRRLRTAPNVDPLQLKLALEDD